MYIMDSAGSVQGKSLWIGMCITIPGYAKPLLEHNIHFQLLPFTTFSLTIKNKTLVGMLFKVEWMESFGFMDTLKEIQSCGILATWCYAWSETIQSEGEDFGLD